VSKSNLEGPQKPRKKTGGRRKGTANKVTTSLKEAILEAARRAGDGDMVNYLETQAKANPGPFIALLGKVLPLQLTGDAHNPVGIIFKTVYEDN